jgi:polyhydroxyalkanoate synthesis regulator phasin
MAVVRDDVVIAATPPPVVRRISWGAILAGVVIALVVQLVLGILGLGIGASTINPLSEANPVAGIGTGAGIWFAVSLLLALFAGGYVAGRMAGIPRRQDGLLHGLLTWGLTILLTFYLLTTTVGSLIGGTARVLGQGLSAVGTGIATAAPVVAGAAGDAAGVIGDQVQGVGDLDLSELQSQVEGILNQVGVDTSGVSGAISEAITTTEQLSETVSEVADDPQSREELAALIQRIATSGGETIGEDDRQDLTDFIVERGGRTPAEAEELVTDLEQTYQRARAQAQEAVAQAQQAGQEALAQAEQTAREAGDAAADAVSAAAIWTFVGLLLSALAAAYGGYLATPVHTI